MLILPNAWDVPSARVFEDAGFHAVASSSARMMVSLGHSDGQTIDRKEFILAIGRLANALAVPFSADVVAGFGQNPHQVAATVRRVIAAGAIGINIEDFVHTT